MSGEKVLVVNLTNGQRLETYAQAETAGKGNITMNGGMARLCSVGDKVTILAFALGDENTKAIKIIVDKNNKYLKNI